MDGYTVQRTHSSRTSTINISSVKVLSDDSLHDWGLLDDSLHDWGLTDDISSFTVLSDCCHIFHIDCIIFGDVTQQ